MRTNPRVIGTPHNLRTILNPLDLFLCSWYFMLEAEHSWNNSELKKIWFGLPVKIDMISRLRVKKGYLRWKGSHGASLQFFSATSAGLSLTHLDKLSTAQPVPWLLLLQNTCFRQIVEGWKQPHALSMWMRRIFKVDWKKNKAPEKVSFWARFKGWSGHQKQTWMEWNHLLSTQRIVVKPDWCDQNKSPVFPCPHCSHWGEPPLNFFFSEFRTSWSDSLDLAHTSCGILLIRAIIWPGFW